MLRLDDLPLQPAKPELVVTAANDIHGLDLLGLRAPAEAVANRFIDGITTITPVVRYFSLRAWLILRYVRLDGLNSWKAFSTFAAKVEAAIAYASKLAENPTPGVVGRNIATGIVNNTDSKLTLGKLTKILAVQIYAAPSEALGLGEGSGEVPSLTIERGLPLAESFGAAVGNDDVLAEISVRDEEQFFERARLADFGRRFTLAVPSPAERQHLLAAIIPNKPRAIELRRIASYCLLLHLSQALGRAISESDVYAATSQGVLAEIPEDLHLVCDGWTQFAVRDLLTLVHESAVALVLQQLSQVVQPEKRQPFREVIAALVAADLDSSLSGLGLGVKADQPISDLYEAVISSCGPASEIRGLRRWPGALSEPVLFEKASWLHSATGLCLVPIAWIIAAHRMEPGIHSRMNGFDLDASAGSYRLGVGAVVLPEVRRWRTESLSIRAIVAWLIHRSVDQHLRIAWSRLAREPYKDVALIRSDGDDWIYQKDFSPGRATSRLYQALNWLRQLCLVDDGGMTTEGASVLEAGLATLRRCGRG